MARSKPVFASLLASRNRAKFPWLTLTILAILILPPTTVIYTLIAPFFRYTVLIYAFAVNLATFLAYRWDKNAARVSGWRVSEVTLHSWALAGGWPAALVAQRVLRHKTRKWSFQLIFWILVLGEELLCLKMLRLL